MLSGQTRWWELKLGTKRDGYTQSLRKRDWSGLEATSKYAIRGILLGLRESEMDRDRNGCEKWNPTRVNKERILLCLNKV